ncbi:hypothetical protein GOP47_0021504 [Adiantum capillus-veneris]|uniref:ATP-dependent DNA helicase n=1 Tax=Adiantum capillus-veneris TaxID=13818 RepID=A0A9D4U7X8_ADICA|nr:hypothetical protein GOP47_0021504 [Adiantum capillus-veneris]
MSAIAKAEVPDKSWLKFSKQQIEVLIAVAQGKSVFITGSAGIGLGTDDAETLAAKVYGKQDCRDRWRRAKVLVIDEISMIDGDLFDKLDHVAREVRKANGNNNHALCFGGLQLIVTGDFFQLPPVKPSNPRKYFAFEADCWNNCFDLQVELKHAFRQSDEKLIGMLDEIRKGCQSPHTLQLLNSCFRVLEDDGSGIAPTRLYPLKVDVREENSKELRGLGNPVFKFSAEDWVAGSFYRGMLDGMRLEKELDLCVGAQVMLVKNFDTEVGFVNGARGVVIGFKSLPFKEGDVKEEVARLINPAMKWPVVRFACNRAEIVIGPDRQTVESGGMQVARRIQVPLILAWALSVHKCQASWIRCIADQGASQCCIIL